MNKILITSILLIFSLAACDSAQKKDTVAVSENTSVSESAIVNQSNSQLAKVPYEGFEYKRASVPAHKYEAWATVAAPVIKKVLDNLPDGYVLMIKGHSDSTVAEKPKGKIVTNQKLSEMRAKAVYDALRKKGLTSENLKYKGVGDSEPVNGVSSTDGKNRRVTFEVVKEN